MSDDETTRRLVASYETTRRLVASTIEVAKLRDALSSIYRRGP